MAIAIIAILAGAIAPLALKAINQQREAKTRESLKLAFEAMFGARDRRVANLRADVGFDPTATLVDLSALMNNPVAGLRSYAADPGAAGMFWGYNGPYWTGSTDALNRPQDGWGRPLRLRVVGVAPNQAWQVQSLGGNGVDENGAGDDLVYPTVGAAAQSFKSVLVLNVTNPAPIKTGTITVKARNGGTTLVTLSTSPYATATVPTLTCSPTAGGVYVSITRTGFTDLNFVVDLLPGEVRSFDVTL
ncbi:MAG: hypothetical protein IPN59_04230 [Holophaga sp.]|nr:hypothetical protein [Holophaga sp.]